MPLFNSLPDFLSTLLVWTVTLVLTTGLLGLCSRVAFSSRAQMKQGWFYLRPGYVHLIAVVLGLALSMVLNYMYFFVGSARVDAERQMDMLFWLCLFFNGGTMIAAYVTSIEQVRWNDTFIERRTVFFERRSMSWHELARFGQEPSEYLWISSFDGPRIRFSPYDSGVGDLIRKILEHLPPDTPAADQAAAEAAALRFAVAGVAR